MLAPGLLETLLHMSEGETLDFKRDQYPLTSDEEKGELIKDILTFANGWRTADAYILIGAQERTDGGADVVGITDHLDDADLQQLVESKTNTRVIFSYTAVEHMGMQLGLIRINAGQERPIYPKKNFGRLHAQTVFVRRGSRTATASPEEIRDMGRAVNALAVAVPQLRIEFGDAETRKPEGPTVEVISHLYDPYTEPRIDPNAALDTFARKISLADRITSFGSSSPQESHEHRRHLARLKRMEFAVTNTGGVLASKIRITLTFPTCLGAEVLDELPNKPGALGMPRLARDATDVRRLHDGQIEVSSRIGNIQPGETRWSAPFWVGCDTEAGARLQGDATLFGDNIPKPLRFTMQITIKGTHRHGNPPKYEED